MIKINDELLQELGLAALPPTEKDSLLKHIYETLEMRVGMRLADQMTNEQLDEFERYFEAKDDAGAFKWLETNFPNYKDIVQEEFDKLKAEVGQTAPQILAASQAQGAQQQVAANQQPLTPVMPQPFQPAQPPMAAPQEPMLPVQPPMSPQPISPPPATQPPQPTPQPWMPPQPPSSPTTDDSGQQGQQPPAGPQAWPPQPPQSNI